MGNQQQTLWQEITQGIGKFIWIIYIFIGLAVKIALDRRTGKMPIKKMAVTLFLSVCAGALASMTCKNFGLEKLGAVIVPVTTLIGEGLFGYIVSNWKKWMDGLMKKVTNGKEK